MMKKLSHNAKFNIIAIAISFAISLILGVIILGLTKVTSPETFNFSKSIIITTGVSVAFFIMCITGILIATKIDVKSQNAIIKKFSLQEGKLTEVKVTDLIDDSNTREILINVIKALSHSDIINYICINNKNISVAFDNISPVTRVLINIIYNLNGKFYLYLDESKRILLVITDSDGKVLHNNVITYYVEILEGAEPI